MNILSLFDGISCGRVALERAGISVQNYYASEIDVHAIKVSKKNWPDIVHIGDVQKIVVKDLPFVPDLIIGGSPCQGFSFAGKQLAFDDPRSKLFFEYVRIVNEARAINPNVFFLLENVKMKKEHLDVISSQLGVHPVCINSALVSAQNRVRFYWANWKFEQPENLGISPNDIIEHENKSINTDGWQKWWDDKKDFMLKKQHSCYMNKSPKAICCTARQVSSWNGNLVFHESGIRFPTPVECERLQTLPDNYTQGVSNTQRYKSLGNGWTVDVIAHIFRGLKNDTNN